ncbi:spore cortex-lytic enzyme [Effusibacillus consociatus]|uniref:Spore cortex-lytic enzyme n=1 Tax=Effusibacillus consociatus TaxID=1117041 RepID=A0ABV9Q8D5_9BACL
MKLKWSILAAGLSLAMAFSVLYSSPSSFERNSTPTFTNRILVKGSTGIDVRELQGRLKLLGFYKRDVDGIFGWSTYWAVRNFQYQFGIKVDGRVGEDTREKLVRATRNYNPWRPPAQTGGRKGRAARRAASPRNDPARIVHSSSRISTGDFNLMANAIHGESRGEPYIGQVAVAAVILNRLENPKFPNSISGIIFQPGAFTAVADGQIWLTPNEESKKAVSDALNGWDPSGGAIYYFNPDTATSKWIWSRPQIKRIGKHIFCR